MIAISYWQKAGRPLHPVHLSDTKFRHGISEGKRKVNCRSRHKPTNRGTNIISALFLRKSPLLKNVAKQGGEFSKMLGFEQKCCETGGGVLLFRLDRADPVVFGCKRPQQRITLNKVHPHCLCMGTLLFVNTWGASSVKSFVTLCSSIKHF